MERRLALTSLMTIKQNNIIDLDFIDKFYDYFDRRDNRCNTRDLNIIASGKVGTVYEYPNNHVLKKINEALSVNTDSYLHLSVSKLPEIDPPTIHNGLRNQNGEHVYLTSQADDDFTNQTIINLILELVLDNNLNYVRQYDAFICKGSNKNYFDGYSIMERANMTLFEYIESDRFVANRENIAEIFRQILPTLKYLKENFDFVHGDLKTKNILVTFDNEDNPVYKLADFDKSSMVFNDIYFYNAGGARFKTYVVDKIGSTLQYPTIETDLGRSYNISSGNVEASYSILKPFFQKETAEYLAEFTDIYNFDYISLITSLRHLPKPFYRSFDYYTFIVSLLLHSKIYDSGVLADILNSIFRTSNLHINRVIQTFYDYQRTNPSRRGSFEYVCMFLIMLKSPLIADTNRIEEMLMEYFRISTTLERWVLQNISNIVISTSSKNKVCKKNCGDTSGWNGEACYTAYKYRALGKEYDWDYCTKGQFNRYNR